VLYLCVCAGSTDSGNAPMRAIDFKGEAMTFKATTAGVLSTLQHCLDMVRQREDVWRKRMDREIERRKRLEELFRTLRHQSGRAAVYAGPDCEVGSRPWADLKGGLCHLLCSTFRGRAKRAKRGTRHVTLPKLS